MNHGSRREALAIAQAVRIDDGACSFRRFRYCRDEDTAATADQKIAGAGSEPVIFDERPIIGPNLEDQRALDARDVVKTRITRRSALNMAGAVALPALIKRACAADEAMLRAAFAIQPATLTHLLCCLSCSVGANFRKEPTLLTNPGDVESICTPISNAFSLIYYVYCNEITRASVSLSRCFSLAISYNFDILYVPDKV
jgi:hypothetical protein